MMLMLYKQLNLKVVNWTRKNTASQMFEGVLNVPLLKNKAGVRCAKRTLDAATCEM